MYHLLDAPLSMCVLMVVHLTAFYQGPKLVNVCQCTRCHPLLIICEQKSLNLWQHMGILCTRLEYDLVNANRVCPGIHKIGVRSAARSAVTTLGFVENNSKESMCVLYYYYMYLG